MRLLLDQNLSWRLDYARVFPGPPPKAIHLAVGNAATSDVDAFLRARLAAVHGFEHDGRRLLVLE
jgi:predicted nuclease of predicted toxin-antitoxin system